jgi:fatty-acyl-CoA synthase
MFVDILNLPDLKQYDLKSLSTGIMAGAPCPEEIAKGTVNDLNMKDFAVVVFIDESVIFNFANIRKSICF